MFASIWPKCISIGINSESTTAVIVSSRRSFSRRSQYSERLIGAEAPISRGRRETKAIPVLVGLGLVLSACSANADYSPPSYAFSGSIHGSPVSDFGNWDGWRGQSIAGIDDGQLGGHVPPPY
jgi:hypothetical protein